MYSLVPAIVYIIIFLVLSPKSASLMAGSGFPGTYLILSNIFSGLRSLCVIWWLCSYWIPLLTWSTTLRASFSHIMLSLHVLSASLKCDHIYHSDPPEQYSQIYHTADTDSITSYIFKMLSFSTLESSWFICFYLSISYISPGAFETFRIARNSPRSLSNIL